MKRTEYRPLAQSVSNEAKDLARIVRERGENPTHILIHDLSLAAIELELTNTEPFFAQAIHGMKIITRSNIPENLIVVFDEEIVDEYKMLTREFNL